MDDLIISALQSTIGLAFGLSVSLAWRLFHRTSGLVKMYVVLSGTLLFYVLVFSLVSNSPEARRGFQLAAMLVVIWALLGANWYFNRKENRHDSQVQPQQ